MARTRVSLEWVMEGDVPMVKLGVYRDSTWSGRNSNFEFIRERNDAISDGRMKQPDMGQVRGFKGKSKEGPSNGQRGNSQREAQKFRTDASNMAKSIIADEAVGGKIRGPFTSAFKSKALVNSCGASRAKSGSKWVPKVIKIHCECGEKIRVKETSTGDVAGGCEVEEGEIPELCDSNVKARATEASSGNLAGGAKSMRERLQGETMTNQKVVLCGTRLLLLRHPILRLV